MERSLNLGLAQGILQYRRLARNLNCLLFFSHPAFTEDIAHFYPMDVNGLSFWDIAIIIRYPE